jgi:Calcineurin-like phosphoesterase
VLTAARSTRMRQGRAVALAAAAAVGLAAIAMPAAAVVRHRHVKVIAAAGDISAADARTDDDGVAAMIASRIRPDAVLTLGDEQYEDGTLADYHTFYDLSWGAPSLLSITYPVPGNHEYQVGPGEARGDPAAGYYHYFQDSAVNPNGAARRAGYYSFNLGGWHLVALNSASGARPSRAQIRWLRRDLDRSRKRCALAYWHHPRWSSGIEHGSDPDEQSLWSGALAGGVDVVLNGHEHLYERFQRKRVHGTPASNRYRGSAATEFVVGTGGKGGNDGFARPLRGSRVRWPAAGSDSVFGALELRLAPRAYRWIMLDQAGTVIDSGGPIRCR